MTTKKSNRAFARTIILTLSILVIALTLHTLSIGLDLVLVSQGNSNAETWRINSQGIKAANTVYEDNMEIRNAIYNSKNAYTRWISTTSKFTQIIVGFALIVLSALSCYIWYSYINMKLRRFRKKLSYRKKQKLIRRNEKTA